MIKTNQFHLQKRGKYDLKMFEKRGSTRLKGAKNSE